VAKRRSRKDGPEDIPLYFALTPNQVVAYNLAQARLLKGWTQEQACEALEPHIGARWSKANYSAAERSVDGNRIRQFDADEIVAFALAFELPVTWFFLPPPPWSSPGIPGNRQTPNDRWGAPRALLVDLVFGDDYQRAEMELRIQAFLDHLGADGPLSDAQRRIVAMVNARKAQLERHALRDLQQWQTELRALANHLEDLEQRVKDTPEG
jgi:hypothetical protein